MFHFPPGAPSGFQVTQLMFFFLQTIEGYGVEKGWKSSLNRGMEESIGH
jgi:hypothetical protein